MLNRLLLVVTINRGIEMNGLRVLMIMVAALALLSSVACASVFPFDLCSNLSGYPSGVSSPPYSSAIFSSLMGSPFPYPASNGPDTINVNNASTVPTLPPDYVGGAKMATGPMNWTYYQGLPINTATECLQPPETAMSGAYFMP
jgi:hypothetical protein